MTAKQMVFREGAVSIEDGSGMASELDIVGGLQFDRGYLSPYFINNAERGAAVLEDVQIVLCDQRLSALKDLVPLLEEVAKSGNPLLVVAEDIDGDALATLVINSMRGVIKTCAVKAPGFGDRRKALTMDSLDENSGIKIVVRALEEPLRRIVDIAALVLSTDCMIADAPDSPKGTQSPAAGGMSGLY